MIEKIKKLKRVYCTNLKIKNAYKIDCKKYILWQYHNPKLHSMNALEAKILRQAHILEKGMSLSNPKPKFGVQKAIELLDFIDEYDRRGFDIGMSAAVINSIAVLKAYLNYHEMNGFAPIDVANRLKKYENYIKKEECDEYGINRSSLADLSKSIHGEFPEFFKSRHSMRQFSPIPVPESEIKKAVDLAMRAPSACNRQSCKVYYYKEPSINKKLGELIAGNNGFSDEVQNYLIITSDISAFYDSFERNQTYIDGGILTMALAEALHYYSIGSCILQMGETPERDEGVRVTCGNIPPNERIIVFLAIGYYKSEFSYALSHRKELKDVLIIK